MHVYVHLENTMTIVAVHVDDLILLCKTIIIVDMQDVKKKPTEPFRYGEAPLLSWYEHFV